MKRLNFKKLILPVVGLASFAAIACSSGDGSESIVGQQLVATAVEIAAETPIEVAPGDTEVPASEAPASILTAVDPMETVVQPVQEPAPDVSGISSVQEIFDTLTPEQIVAAEEEVIVDIFERVVGSTVQIVVGTPGAGGGTGSGFVWDEEGRIVTNHHVVTGFNRVRVLFPDGTDVQADVLGTDPDSDLAVIEVNLPASYLVPVFLGDSDALRPGEIALAIGAPFDRDFTFTRGIISALGRTIKSPRGQYSIPDAIQTDASINPGNSGGPLLDRQGRVIGINSQIESAQGVNTGIGFAVPINQAKRVIPALIEDGEYEYSWLGVTVGDLTAAGAQELGLPVNTRGAILGGFIEDGPAANSPLEPGDIVTAIDGTEVREFDDLISYLAARTSPGDIVRLEVIRNGDEIDVRVELGARPSAG